MDAKRSYLRPDVRVRPLFNRWTATEQMIPPMSAAMIAKNCQAPMLASYADAPEHHYKAARTPRLIGGPWVDVHPDRRGEIDAMLRAIETELQPITQLATAIDRLDALLREEARGQSLEPLYPRVPDVLRGYVELVYDLNGYPGIRFLESLLYRSPHHHRELQSVLLQLATKDHRAFEYNTPWVPEPGDHHLRVPFDHPGLDVLFGMRRRPGSLGEVAESLEVDPARAAALGGLLTSTPPRPYERFGGPGVRIRYFGHACVLFETAGVSILTDPMVSYATAESGAPARFTFEDLPDTIDYVVLTHAHKDHFYLETLLQLRGRCGTIVIPRNNGGSLHDPSFRLMLHAVGFRSIVELERLEPYDVPGGAITALPFLGEHADLDVQSKAAHLVRLEGNAILCAADSNNVEPRLYQHLHGILGDIDAIFIGMECVGAPLSAVYGGLLTRRIDRKHDESRRTTGCNGARAQAIVDELGPQHVYVYAMGLEPWLSHILPIQAERDRDGIEESDRLIAHCRARGITAARPYCQHELLLAPKRA